MILSIIVFPAGAQWSKTGMHPFATIKRLFSAKARDWTVPMIDRWLRSDMAATMTRETDVLFIIHLLDKQQNICREH